ncbi:MAG TPA: helix-turn-helix transcriptional regulator [Acidimicrobiia bacterium]
MELGRFTEVGLLIMVGLTEGPKHGYALIEEVGRLRGSRPGPGTLYGAIARLEQDGLIESLDTEDRRIPYRLTTAGRAALTAELASLERLLDTARTRLATA